WRRFVPEPHPAGRHARRHAAGASRTDHAGGRARRAQCRLYPHRPFQGYERGEGCALACGAQCTGAGRHHGRPAIRLADRPGRRHREAVRMARHRLAFGRQRGDPRHSRGAGHDPRHRAVVPRHQHRRRSDLCRDRSAHQAGVTGMRLGFNFWLGASLTVLVILAGVLAPWIAPFDPVLDADLMNSELPPDATFWFGTDGQGRDVYTRILYGAQISLTVGIVSQVINSVIGITLGMTAAYWGGWWDDLVNGLTNVMLAIPSLIFALAIMAVLGPGLMSLLIALGLTNWSWTCRIARSSTLSLKSQGYVQAAETLGYSDLRIMFTQILPNILGPILVMATLVMGSAVLAEAALSFLGLGIQPAFPSWGSVLTDPREMLRIAPWAAIFPGLAIFLAVLGF